MGIEKDERATGRKEKSAEMKSREESVRCTVLFLGLALDHMEVREGRKIENAAHAIMVRRFVIEWFIFN